MKTTSKHFQLYQKEVKKWIVEFGLKGWEVAFVHTANMEGVACCKYELLDRTATFKLKKVWKSIPVNNYELRKSAYHEVCELLLCRLRSLAEYRFTTRAELEEEFHAVIRTLENTFFE